MHFREWESFFSFFHTFNRGNIVRQKENKMLHKRMNILFRLQFCQSEVKTEKHLCTHTNTYIDGIDSQQQNTSMLITKRTEMDRSQIVHTCCILGKKIKS